MHCMDAWMHVDAWRELELRVIPSHCLLRSSINNMRFHCPLLQANSALPSSRALKALQVPSLPRLIGRPAVACIGSQVHAHQENMVLIKPNEVILTLSRTLSRGAKKCDNTLTKAMKVCVRG